MKPAVQRPRLLGIAFLTMSALVLAPMSVAGAASAPKAPVGVRAHNDAGVAVVSWSPSASKGGAPIKTYVVTSHPLSRNCVAKTTSCKVARLTPGRSYTFTVVARSAAGTSANSPHSNAVKIPSAGANYLTAVNALNDAVATDFVAINNAIQANPDGSLAKELKALSKAYAAFTATLRAGAWPANAHADIASVVADESAVSTDSVDLYQGSAASAPAIAAALQAADNTEVEADAKVRTDLGLSQVITPPITTTPTPTSLGAAATVHDFTNDELSVTVTQVVDPATAAAGSGLPDAGTRFVAVDLSLADETGGSVSGDANYSTTVVGTDGKTYTADIGSVEGCTNFTLGTFQLAGVGTNQTGCVVFELPTAVYVATVGFSLAPGYLDSGEWSN